MGATHAITAPLYYRKCIILTTCDNNMSQCNQLPVRSPPVRPDNLRTTASKENASPNHLAAMAGLFEKPAQHSSLLAPPCHSSVAKASVYSKFRARSRTKVKSTTSIGDVKEDAEENADTAKNHQLQRLVKDLERRLEAVTKEKEALERAARRKERSGGEIQRTSFLDRQQRGLRKKEAEKSRKVSK